MTTAARRVALRRRLSLLVLAAILPLALMSGVGLNALVSQQRLQAERASVDLARALGTAVAGELRLNISALQTLATSAELDLDEDFAGFDALLRSVLRSRPEWRYLMLVRPDGTVLSSNSATPGHELTRTLDMESLTAAIQRAAPAIGPLVRGPQGHWGIPVRVPVFRDGQLRFMLTAVLKPEAMHALVLRQRVPSSWVVSVWDARERRVARSRMHEQRIGAGPTPTLKQLLANGRSEGIGPTRTFEGDAVYTAFTRLPETGWAVTVAVPEEVVLGGARQSLLAYGGGVLGSLVIGLMAAFAMARRINGPMGQLRDAARALGTGEPLAPPGGDILEIHEVSDALVAAATQHSRSETERERLLQAEREAHALAAAAMHEAQHANRAKDEFLAMLGHELRNPLSPIVTALHLMSRREPEVHAFERRIIERQVAHMTRLVDDLLDVSRITRGKIELRREQLDLRAVVERALEMTRPLYGSREHAVTLVLPQEAVQVWGDWVRLAQVVSNLLSNAAKFTPASGVVSLTLRTTDTHAEITVSDTGNGIAAELLPKVFDLFTQGPQEIHRGTGGLGLGLAIVRTLVQLHDGTVSARSDGPGRGACFTVSLPLMAEAAPAALVDGNSPPEPEGHERVLLVDDNADAAETLSAVLRDSGYDVRIARDGFSALAMLEDFPADVAVLDIGLPGMSGHELAAELRSRTATQHLPLIALTGYGTASDRTVALAAGFQEHLVKPVDPHALLQLVRRTLDGRKA